MCIRDRVAVARRRHGGRSAVAALFARTATAVRYRPVAFDRMHAVTFDVLAAVAVLDARILHTYTRIVPDHGEMRQPLSNLQ